MDIEAEQMSGSISLKNFKPYAGVCGLPTAGTRGCLINSKVLDNNQMFLFGSFWEPCKGQDVVEKPGEIKLLQ